MDIVKAVINIKEGVIELEGPQEFVEKYLELYRPDASKWQTALLQKGEVKTKEEAPKRVRTAKPKRGVTCAEKVLELRSEGYFKEPRARAEVQQYLKEKKGLIYKSNEVAANLKNLFSRGELQRLTEGKTFKYYSNV
ncbi:hypothetical protein ES703_91373 [subsurface metagenome]